MAFSPMRPSCTSCVSLFVSRFEIVSKCRAASVLRPAGGGREKRGDMLGAAWPQPNKNLTTDGHGWARIKCKNGHWIYPCNPCLKIFSGKKEINARQCRVPRVALRPPRRTALPDSSGLHPAAPLGPRPAREFSAVAPRSPQFVAVNNVKKPVLPVFFEREV